MDKSDKPEAEGSGITMEIIPLGGMNDDGGGSDLRRLLMDKLRETLGGDHLAGEPVSDKTGYPTPATYSQARELIEAVWFPTVGDVVEAKPTVALFCAFPQPGERMVVTQVLPQPLHGRGEEGSPTDAVTPDIALAFVAVKRGTQQPAVVEYLHDSRFFTRVGSIYDEVPPAQSSNGDAA